MCLMSSAPEAPPTPAPPPAQAPAAAPLDLKLNKDDKTASAINKKNKAGKRKFRVDKKSESAQMNYGSLGTGSTMGGLQIKKKT